MALCAASMYSLWLLGTAWGHGTGDLRLQQLNIRLAARPAHVESLAERAVILSAKKEHDLALLDVRTAKSIQPQISNWDLLEADILTKCGRTAEAEPILRNVTKKHPQSPRAWESLARLMLAKEQWAEAVACLDHLFILQARPQPGLILARVNAAEKVLGPEKALQWLIARPAEASLPALAAKARQLQQTLSPPPQS